MQACAVGATEVSVESVDESIISKYNHHKSNVGPIGEDTADNYGKTENGNVLSKPDIELNQHGSDE